VNYISSETHHIAKHLKKVTLTAFAEPEYFLKDSTS